VKDEAKKHIANLHTIMQHTLKLPADTQQPAVCLFDFAFYFRFGLLAFFYFPFFISRKLLASPSTPALTFSKASARSLQGWKQQQHQAPLRAENDSF
jgi:hypothetical protein